MEQRCWSVGTVKSLLEISQVEMGLICLYILSNAGWHRQLVLGKYLWHYTVNCFMGIM